MSSSEEKKSVKKVLHAGRILKLNSKDKLYNETLLVLTNDMLNYYAASTQISINSLIPEKEPEGSIYIANAQIVLVTVK